MPIARGVVLTLAALAASIFLGAAPAQAQSSRCVAIARSLPPDIFPKVQLASFQPALLGEHEVSITFVGHSTFLIESAAGVRVATDYAGYAGQGVIPDVVTMNRAHSSHYTPSPDPRIAHVLRGWDTDGARAEHYLPVEDILIRNVTTDIRGSGFSADGGYAGSVQYNGNSIFIFEVADLCIGHLGHLHHKLDPEHYALIGRLDVVMAPVDGGRTLDLTSMMEVLKNLRASIVIPMHFFGAGTLSAFMQGMSDEFEVRQYPSPTIKVSIGTLPKTPTVVVLPGY